MGYLCDNFSLPTPLCSRLRPDVRDREMSDVKRAYRLMPPTLGVGHNNIITSHTAVKPERKLSAGD